jgi:hypothetical protein
MKNICLGLVLIVLASSACRPNEASREEGKNKMQTVVLGQVRIGNEATEFYIAYRTDAAILGFSLPDAAGGARYFPMYASTYRGVPSVVLDVFASKAEDEMWVRSSLPGGEVLAYHRIGADTAITQFGNVTFLKEPLPPYLSGGPIPFPEMTAASVLKKATFKHVADDGTAH